MLSTRADNIIHIVVILPKFSVFFFFKQCIQSWLMMYRLGKLYDNGHDPLLL